MNPLNLSLVSSQGNPFEELKRVSVDIELALIGACLINPEAIDRAGPHVDAADFSEPFIGGVWQLMRDQHAQGIRLSPMLVIARLSSPETVTALRATLNCSPAEFVGRVGSNAISVSGAADYAKTIREFAARRRLYSAGSAMIESMRDPGADMRQAASALAQHLEQALNAGHKPTMSANDIIRMSIDALENPQAAPGYTTGLRDIDRITGGFVPGDLWVLGGRPSMGKSALSCSTALASARASFRILCDAIGGDPWSVLIMSQEMTHAQVMQRWLTDLAYDHGDPWNPVEYRRFRPIPGEAPQALTAMQRHAMRKAADLLPQLPIKVHGTPGLRVSEVTATIRQHKRRMEKRGTPLRVVVVDHIGLGKVLPDREDRGRVDELGEITSTLKACAVNEDLCIVAAHQLARAMEGRENKRPGLADFRDSGHIEQDADVMVGVFRNAYYLERNRESDPAKEAIRSQLLAEQQNAMEAFILKNRSGGVGTADLFAQMGANAIRDKLMKDN